MSPSYADTQPVRAIQSGPGCLKRIVQLLFLAILAVSLFACGYATGTGVETLAPANALIETAIASFPDSLTTLSARLPLPNFTVADTPMPTAAGSLATVAPQPADTQTPVTTDTSTPLPTDTPTDTLAPTAIPTNTPSDTPMPTAAQLLATVKPQPAHTQTPVTTDTSTPLPTDTPTNTLAPTDIPTDTPIPTNTPSDTPMPTATEPPPTRTPLPTATRPLPSPTALACYQHQQAWVSGQMNVREQPSVNAQKVGSASAGERFDVLESRQGDSYCWLRISRGWMAKTNYVSATEPQQPLRSVAGGSVGQALANLNTLVVAPEHRCSPYDSDSYPYSQSVEAQIVARMGGRIYGPYTGTTFSSTGETDIEHIVAKSEAHDSGLCSANAQMRRTFSNDLLNLTLASPSVNRHQKSGKDFAEWRPALNQCWFADAIIRVKAKYRLTVDSREKAALESTLQSCGSVSMVFSGTAPSVAASSASSSQPASSSQNQQPASNPVQQPASGNWQQWDSNGNGRITCAEARAAGIAPVHRGHPAYPRMDDRDNDGVVCE